jgi:uncharacterized protein (DUF433 family)
MSITILENGRIQGTRSSIYDIVHYLENGFPPDEIAAVLNLSLDEVRAAMEHIDKNREQVMAVHREIEDRIARGNPPEVEEKFTQSRMRLQSWRSQRMQAKTLEANGARNPRRRR